jgi:hypothetical protein
MSTKKVKCTKCKKDKNIDEFLKGKKQLKTCLTCRITVQKWRNKNKERTTVYNKAYKEGKDWEKVKKENGIIDKKKPSPKRILHKFIDKIETKRCFKCKEWKEINNFNNSSTTWDKLRYDCKDCLKEYRKSIKDKMDMVIECNICNKKVKKRSMYDHKRNLHSEKTYKWKCDLCCITFKHEKIYKRHLEKEFHNRKQRFTDIDDDELKEKILELLKYNTSNIEDIEKCFKCNICNDFFSTQHLLELHNISHDESLNCSKCDKNFKRKDTLQRHFRNVHGDNKIKCKLCKKEMTKRNYKERHIKLCAINHLICKYPGESKWERFVSKFLIDNDIDFESQKKFCNLKRKQCLPYDFYLKKSNILIEVNGKLHYELSNYRNAKEIFDRNQDSDKRKKKFAKKNDIKLIVIDTRKYNDFDKISTHLQKKLKIKNNKAALNINEYLS